MDESVELKISFSLRDLEKMDVADPLFPNKVNEAYQKFKVINSVIYCVVYTMFMSYFRPTSLRKKL
jgi:hypothetical protein